MNSRGRLFKLTSITDIYVWKEREKDREEKKGKKRKDSTLFRIPSARKWAVRDVKKNTVMLLLSYTNT